MDAGTGIPLLPPGALSEAIAEANERVAAIPSSESAYRTLVELARIHQQTGNRLGDLVYRGIEGGPGPQLACKVGCSSCCASVPSKVRGHGVNYFMLTILDIVTLVENYPAIKGGIGDLLERATAAVDTARAEHKLVACPYLAPSGTCGIYAYRPVACKLWFSGDLAHCLRHREAGWRYPGLGIDTFDIASNRLREYVEAPVMARAEAVLGGAPVGDYDYLTVFAVLARLDSLGQIETLKAKIDSGELAQWDPFEVGGTAE